MWQSLMTALSMFDPMEWLTIGLVLFAGAQVYVQVRTEQQRRLERKSDRDRSDDLAFQLAWAEQFRIDGLADEWDKTDLVQLSLLGVLTPGDVLPRDWTAVTSALVSLSVESGYLAGVALTLAHDTARKIALLNSIVTDVHKAVGQSYGVRGQYPNETSVISLAATVRKAYPEAIAELEKEIRTTTRDLSRLMFDALRQSPRSELFRIMNFRDDMRSTFGQNAVKAIKDREQEALERERKRNPPRSLWSGVLRRLKPREDRKS